MKKFALAKPTRQRLEKNLVRARSSVVASFALLLLLGTMASPRTVAAQSLAPDGAALTQGMSLTSPWTDESVDLTSVAAFSEFGGSAVVESERGSEVFAYSGTDLITNQLYGIRREGQVLPHPAGSSVRPLAGSNSSQRRAPAFPSQPARPPSNPSADSPEAQQAIEDGSADTGGETLGAPTSTWMMTHCANPGSSNSVRPLYIFDSVNDASTTLDDLRVSNPVSKIRDEIIAADRAAAQSHSTFKQHLKIACTRTSSGEAWLDIATVSYAISADADTNKDGFISCNELEVYIPDFSIYGTSGPDNLRYISFLDSSVAGSGCSIGGVPNVDLQNMNNPGTSNPNNFNYGYAFVDHAEWSATGVSNRSVMVTLQEFHHSIGLMKVGTPSLCCSGHSRDYRDFMNGGYCTPKSGADCTDGQEILTTCSPTGLTFPDSYYDCGRQDYWNPTAPIGSWLCGHYNIAWDSLYYTTRATPTAGCR